MNARPTRPPPFTLAGTSARAGERTQIDLPIPGAYGRGDHSLPVVVMHGRRPGPRLFVTAALHGDELTGVEIIRRLLLHPSLRRLRGTLVAIPVVNIYGLVNHSRYLPDRRDLNRSFPGSPSGSLAARLADILMREVVSHCSHGIDLHSGAGHRENLPQVRGRLADAETRRLARAFGVPVMLHADVRDGSLRQAVGELGIPMIVYEGGQALRLDEFPVRAGLEGILAVLSELAMLPARRRRRPPTPFAARRTTWVRAPASGVMRSFLPLGAAVAPGDLLGCIADPTGTAEAPVRALCPGVIIGRSNLPLVNEGDALYHIAGVVDSAQAESAADSIESFGEMLDTGDEDAEELPIV